MTMMFKERCPNQNVPDAKTCKQISNVFFKLAVAHKAYGEAAEGLAMLASNVTPDQYTMLLVAAAMPAIQVIVPGQMVGPLTTPQLHQAETSTALGHPELIKFTKSQILPDPYSLELTEADKNSATRVLAAAVFLKIEKLYFDDTTFPDGRFDTIRLQSVAANQSDNRCRLQIRAPPLCPKKTKRTSGQQVQSKTRTRTISCKEIKRTF